MRFLRGGESLTVRDELTTIESALQGLGVELAHLQAARPDPPVVSRAWIEGRVDELTALVAQDPVRARFEIRKHLDGLLVARRLLVGSRPTLVAGAGFERATLGYELPPRSISD